MNLFLDVSLEINALACKGMLSVIKEQISCSKIIYQLSNTRTSITLGNGSYFECVIANYGCGMEKEYVLSLRSKFSMAKLSINFQIQKLDAGKS